MESVFSKLRPFTGADWACYAGCNGTNPMICDHDDYVVVVDELTINLVLDDDGSQLSRTCKNTGELLSLLRWYPRELFDHARSLGFRGL